MSTDNPSPMNTDASMMSHMEAIRGALIDERRELERQRQELAAERARFGEERRLFEVEKRALRDRVARGTGMVCPMNGDVVELNVGGRHFTTSLTTLRHDPASLLTALFDAPSKIPLDPDGRFFLDYSGDAFDYVLKHLRGDKFFVKRGDPLVAEVFQLAHRLNLTSFVRVIEKVLRNVKAANGRARSMSGGVAAGGGGGGGGDPGVQQEIFAKQPPQMQPQHPQSPSKVKPSGPTHDPYISPRGGVGSRPHNTSQSPLPRRRVVVTDAGIAVPTLDTPMGVGVGMGGVTDPLQRALKRQRAKLDAKLGAVALEHVHGEQMSSQAVSSWEQHWKNMGN